MPDVNPFQGQTLVTSQQIILTSRAEYPLQFAYRQARKYLRNPLWSRLWVDEAGRYFFTIYTGPGTPSYHIDEFIETLNDLETVKWSGSENFYGRFLEASPITDLEIG